MTVLTEGRHTGGFMVSEANGHRSRETGTVASGQNLVAGTPVQENASGKLVAFTGLADTAGTTITAAKGVIYDNVDATGGDVTGAVYIARDAEVNESEMTFQDSTIRKQRAIDSLALLGIVCR